MSERLALAMQAKTEYPATERAVEAMVNHLAAQWAVCDDPAKREALWFRVKGLQDIRDTLLAAASEADIEAYVSELPKEFQP